MIGNTVSNDYFLPESVQKRQSHMRVLSDSKAIDEGKILFPLHDQRSYDNLRNHHDDQILRAIKGEEMEDKYRLYE